MKYQQDLQIQLQERYRRLYKSKYQLFGGEIGYLITYIRSVPVLKAIVDRLEDSSASFDPAEWPTDHFNFELPPGEDERAQLVWHKMQTWASDTDTGPMFGLSLDRGETNLNAGARLVTEQMIEPFVEYLQYKLGTSSDVLYLLERYARRVAWFDQDDLWDRYEADTTRGEAIYDANLRSFLFDQGVEHPFSQPRSASGDADVVADLDNDDPLVCEVKLFDGSQYGKPYVAKGFRQAVEYAIDYGKSTAYLVIFDLSEKRLELPSDAPAKDWPPRVESQGVTVFMVRVRARPRPSASKLPQLPVVSISVDDLVGALED